jgi:cytochrome P450
MSTAQQVPGILSPEFAANPYPAHRMMRDSAPLIRHEATQSWIVSRYEDVERVFKDCGGQFTTEIGVHAGSFVLCLPRRVQVGRWEPLCRASSVRVSCPQ